MTIVPMSERRARMPMAGKIRLGVKQSFVNGKGERKSKPVSIETFRFTCRRREDLDMIATLYGGTVGPWSDPKSEDTWEVITTSDEIKVALPPDPLTDSFYELWGGKGLTRQCDGETCSVPQWGPQGTEFTECPCICRSRGVKECKPKLRLNVLLPEIPMRGVWRLETGSEAALDEMPGMVETLQHLQGEGLTMGLLRLEKRQSSGGSKRYVVPVLGIAESLEGLIAGRARLAALPQSAGGVGDNAGSVRPQLPPAPSLDDEVVDAELVDEEPSSAEKARQLRAARATAILNGDEPPTSWEEIDA